MGADDGSPDRARRRPRRWRLGAAGLAVAAIAVLGLGFGLRGSDSTIPAGVSVAGVDVAGLTAEEALAKLDERSAGVANEPVLVIAEGKGVRLTPAQVALDVDWSSAVERALTTGKGFGPWQGLKRLGVRVAGHDIEPTAGLRRKAVREKLELLTAHLDEPALDPNLRVEGVDVVLEPGRAGTRIPVGRAIALVEQALIDPEQASVRVPVEHVDSEVAEAGLAKTRTLLEAALSAPVTVKLEDSTFRVSPERIAPMLRVRASGRALTLAGPEAKAFFRELASAVKRPAADAWFEIAEDDTVTLIPHTSGRKLDIPGSEAALLAALTDDERTATLAVKNVEPSLTTAEAEAMGIVGVVGTYTTSYGGEAGRKANVRLVSRLVDDHFIAPGAVFSFNETTGERNASKGFVEAPVIINGEVETALGGGVCQVSTTVYNAAFEAGLGIERRVNHALYLDYYPTGRDATVNFPNIDMQFRNDTENWLLLRVGVGEDELTVTLYGTPVGRKVITKTSKLRATERPEIEQIIDAGLRRGTKEVEKQGAPAREVSVRRIVQDASGEVLYDDRWDSSYLAEKRIVRVGDGEPATPAPPPVEPTEPVAPADPPSPPDVPVADAPAELANA